MRVCMDKYSKPLPSELFTQVSELQSFKLMANVSLESSD